MNFKKSLNFLYVGLLLLFVSFLFNIDKTLSSLLFFKNILISLIPVLVLIFVFSFLVDLFLNTKKLIKYLGKHSGFKGWLLSIIGGLISTGPLYMWYPLLKDLKDKGMKQGLIATFLYSRAVKLPLLPVLIIYFGLKFSLVLLIILIIFSIIQGLIIEFVMKKWM